MRVHLQLTHLRHFSFFSSLTFLHTHSPICCQGHFYTHKQNIMVQVCPGFFVLLQGEATTIRFFSSLTFRHTHSPICCQCHFYTHKQNIMVQVCPGFFVLLQGEATTISCLGFFPRAWIKVESKGNSASTWEMVIPSPPCRLA